MVKIRVGPRKCGNAPSPPDEMRMVTRTHLHGCHALTTTKGTRERTTQSIPHLVGTRHPVACRLTGGREVRGGSGTSQLCVKVEASARAHRRRPWSALCDPRTADLLRLYSALYRCWTSYYYYCYGAVIFFSPTECSRACASVFLVSAPFPRIHVLSVFLPPACSPPPATTTVGGRLPGSCGILCFHYHYYYYCVIIGQTCNWHAREIRSAGINGPWPAEFSGIFPSRSCRTAKVRRSNRWWPSPVPSPPPPPRWWRPEAACNRRRITWWRRRTADNSSNRTWPSPRTTANRIRKKRNFRRLRPTCTAGAARPAAINSRPLRTNWSTGWAVSCAAPCAWICRERPSTRWAQPDAPVLPFAKPAVIVVVAHQLTDTPPSLPPPLPPPPPLGQRHR